MKFSLKQILLLIALLAIILGFASWAIKRPIRQEISAIAFSPLGTRIAIQGDFNTQIFDIGNGRRVDRLPIHVSVHQQFIEFGLPPFSVPGVMRVRVGFALSGRQCSLEGA